MYTVERTNSDDLDFQKLVVDLDKYLAITDGEEHVFYAQFNKINVLNHVVVVYENEMAVGCGAIKKYSDHVTEIKRMYVPPSHRGKGIASMVLNALEDWAKELGFQKCILETGIRQVEAVNLYEKNNFVVTENYGQYVGLENSICFEKKIG